MAKRIVIRIGDVFCAEIDGVFKRYFQYVCDDMAQLNSSVIRVFKRRYPITHEPSLSDIVNDDIDFCAHTIIRIGVEENSWYKVGKGSMSNQNELEKILWGTARDIKFIDCRTRVIVDPMENWTVWYTNEERVSIGKLPTEYMNIIENGTVVSFVDIIARLKLGYYTYASPVYDIIKRIPYSDVDSYTRKEFEGRIVWSHFRGEFVVQEIAVKENGETILSEGNPLDRPKFWQTNWKYNELISKEEFEEAWNRSVK